jgi:large subunit ribosomal protein L21
MVAGEVLQHTRGEKVIAFKKRRRKNSRRKRGYRHDFTVIRITEILMDGQKPAKEAPARPQRAPKPAVAEGDEAAAPAKKAAAKKPAAKAAAKKAAKPATSKKK